MDLKELENRSVLLLGKSRAFSDEEFEAQMKAHKISALKEYGDDVVLVIEGKMMTPYEQNESDKLYEEKELEFISIDNFEKELAKFIDDDTLLMSLKLSRDKTRLKSFLQNTTISDELFLKLLKLYSWSGEDFFENDDNRDVTAALILRFYKNIEQNHNVQYATLGLMHLLMQTRDEKLIEAVAMLEPLQKSLKSGEKDANFVILKAIATHANTPKSVVKNFIKYAASEILTLFAMRVHCDEKVQNEIYETDDVQVLEALSYNEGLNHAIALKMIEAKQYEKNIAKYIRLDQKLFELLAKNYSQELAMNSSLSNEMQETLIEHHDELVNKALASNINLNEDVALKLLCQDDQDVKYAIYANTAAPVETLEEASANPLNHIALSHNEKTPKHILEMLSGSSDIKVLEGLAKNPSTPVEVLYQLQLDRRLERAVKENPAFGEHIKTANIGWEV